MLEIYKTRKSEIFMEMRYLVASCNQHHLRLTPIMLNNLEHFFYPKTEHLSIDRNLKKIH